MIIKDNDLVCKISSYDEIVFDNESCLFGRYDKFFDDFVCDNMLFRVEVSWRFVDKEDIGRDIEYEIDGNLLKFIIR